MKTDKQKRASVLEEYYCPSYFSIEDHPLEVGDQVLIDIKDSLNLKSNKEKSFNIDNHSVMKDLSGEWVTISEIINSNYTGFKHYRIEEDRYHAYSWAHFAMASRKGVPIYVSIDAISLRKKPVLPPIL